MVVSPRQRDLVTFWLMPAAPETDLFAELIKTLARELKAPLFPAHLTLFSGGLAVGEARRLLRDFESKAFSLSIERIDHSSQFTKTLFVRFRSSAALDRLARTLQREAGVDSRKVADPHLSLCYKKLGLSTRRDLASFIQLPFRKVRFNRVMLALCRAPTRNAADVKAWRTVSSIRLRD